MRRRGVMAAAWAAALVAVSLAGCGGGANAPVVTMETISPGEAADLVARAPAGLVILDVRPSLDFADAHLAGAVGLDASRPDFSAQLAALDRDVPYLLYCWTGETSAAVREMMRDLGFVEVYEIQGGIVAWAEEGRPFVVP